MMNTSSLLPADNAPWPPREQTHRYRQMRVADAWYAGSPERLTAVYNGFAATQTTTTTPPTTLNPHGSRRVSNRTTRNWFWAPQDGMTLDSRRHLNTPQDIATVSAETLVGERPEVRVTSTAANRADGTPDPAQQAAQQRLDRILTDGAFWQTLQAALEVSAALGSTGLRIALGGVADYPVVTRVDADATVPVYQWGQLVGVTFWNTIRSDKRTIWRLLEAYSGNRMEVGLYKGDGNSLGQRVPFQSIPETQYLVDAQQAGALDDAGTYLFGDDPTATVAVSLPNILPDPLDRRNQAGRSDYTPAVIQLFDSIDRTYSEMMEAIDDARSRLFISDSLLEDRGRGRGQSFDPAQRLFNTVTMPPSEQTSDRMPIQQVKFEMHIAEYFQAIDGLTDRVVHAAGYNAQTMGDEGGNDATATLTRARTRRTMSTRDRKISYIQGPLTRLLTTLQHLDAETYSPVEWVDGQPVQVVPMDVTVAFPETIQPTQIELAETAKAMLDAQASTMETRVRTMHPDWDEPRVIAEVQAAQAEQQVVDPTTFGMAGQGLSLG